MDLIDWVWMNGIDCAWMDWIVWVNEIGWADGIDWVGMGSAVWMKLAG